MREKKFTKEFQKQISKLKGQELINLINKIDEILVCSDLNHYKNLRKPLQKYKRVHVNKCYVILFSYNKVYGLPFYYKTPKIAYKIIA